MKTALLLPHTLLQAIQDHLEAAYPEEGVGFLLGQEYPRKVEAILPLPNRREHTARQNRYLIAPEDYLQAELSAEQRGLVLLGVFHSHPDHPNQPSEYDRQWAQPFFSYLITCVQQGTAAGTRSWRLLADRSAFIEEALQILPE